MTLKGQFIIRIKNPEHNDYDAIQMFCNIKLQLHAVLQENFILTGKINNMSIEVENMKAFYYEDEDDKKSIEETQDQIDNLVGMFQEQVRSTFKRGF